MKILCVGAAGSGMGAIVRWHLRLGDAVFVHDDFADAGELVKKYPGAKGWNGSGIDLAVFSDAVPQGHPLRLEAAARKIPMRGFSEELGALCTAAHRRVIAIAGTHGKSSTTALLSWIFSEAGRDPLCFIGADIAAWGGGFRFGAGPVIVEADEYKKHFLNLASETAIITSLEMDHFDIYADGKELVETFVEFCAQPSVKSVFIARGQPMLDELAEKVSAKNISVIRFGGENGLASNVLGAIAAGEKEGIAEEAIREAIASFPGILRRMERLGTIGGGASSAPGVPVYSDYAHHATAVRETLKRLREKLSGEGKSDAAIGVVFEPHERLRTSRLKSDYERAFAAADAVALLPVYEPKGRERTDIPEADYTLSLSLADGAREDTEEAVRRVPDYAAAIAWAKHFAHKNPGGVIIVMGAGPVDGAFRKAVG